jgi:hypothetical protein
MLLTILYARVDSGFLAMRYARGIERIWVWISARVRAVARASSRSAGL